MTEVTIDGVVYVPKQQTDELPYCIVRTRSAGVFAGYVEHRDGQEVVLLAARRIWQWKGSASLSQLAQSGTSCPAGCKFPEEVDRVVLLEAIEILDCTPAGKKSIAEVPIWKQ